MISMRTDRITWGVLVVGLLTATAACDLVAATRQVPAVEPAPAVTQAPARQSVPAATASTPGDARPAVMVTPDTPVGTAAPAGVESRAVQRGSTDAEDPRAVIDWLLNRSSTR